MFGTPNYPVLALVCKRSTPAMMCNPRYMPYLCANQRCCLLPASTCKMYKSPWLYTTGAISLTWSSSVEVILQALPWLLNFAWTVSLSSVSEHLWTQQRQRPQKSATVAFYYYHYLPRLDWGSVRVYWSEEMHCWQPSLSMDFSNSSIIAETKE